MMSKENKLAAQGAMWLALIAAIGIGMVALGLSRDLMVSVGAVIAAWPILTVSFAVSVR